MSKARKIVVSNIEAKQAKTTFSMDAEGQFSADGLFQKEGATAEDFAVATFARAFEAAFIDKSGEYPYATTEQGFGSYRLQMDFTKIRKNRLLQGVWLDKPTLPEAAAQRPDIDTITPALT